VADLRWLVENEFACAAEDVLWRRGKLGLRLNEDERAAVTAWMTQNQSV
jgi:glycerol-3-phosphate dehydrogenase